MSTTARRGGGQRFSQANFSSKNTSQQEGPEPQAMGWLRVHEPDPCGCAANFFAPFSRYDSAIKIPSQKLWKKEKKCCKVRRQELGTQF